MGLIEQRPYLYLYLQDYTHFLVLVGGVGPLKKWLSHRVVKVVLHELGTLIFPAGVV